MHCTALIQIGTGAGLWAVRGALLLTAVCLCLPVKEPGSGPRWLEDYTRPKAPDQNAMLADSPLTLDLPETQALCPAEVTEASVAANACQQTPCISDLACAFPTGYKCCFNGCVKTCLRAVPPSSVVDWVVEPPRDPDSGQSWLMRLDEMVTDAAPTVPPPPGDMTHCSLGQGPEEDKPFCPEGYVCHLYDIGGIGKLQDFPQGKCIFDSGRTVAERQLRLMSGRTSPAGCQTASGRRQSGETFTYHGYHCACHEGDVTCRVGKPLNDKMLVT